MTEQTNTEDLPTGIRSVEQSQGFERMKMAVPDRDDYTDIDVEQPLDSREAADELTHRRGDSTVPEGEPALDKPPLERRYNQQSGSHAGERMPENNVVELDRASRDLTGARESEVSAEQSALDLELQRQIDALRSGDAQQQPEQPQEPYRPQEEQAQPTEPQSEVADIWSNPTVINEVSGFVNQVNQNVETLKAQYVQGLAQNAATAYAAVTASFPELRSANTINDIPTVINTVAASNPERAKAMVTHLQEVNRLAETAQAAQREQAQAYYAQQQQAFSNFAQQHDDAFQKHFDTVVPPAQQGDIQKEALAMLHEQGLTDQEISALWGTPAFRSVAAQKVILDATLYRRARQGIKTRAANPVPTVQRPGSPAARGSEADYNLSKYSAELDRTGSAKSAAALLSARRTARR